MNTSELTDNALDWAVEVALVVGRVSSREQAVSIASSRNKVFNVGYSTNWASGGPIIEMMMASGLQLKATYRNEPGLQCAASLDQPYGFHFGATALIAALRCFVASELGDEVDVPEELM
jgi:hypothetical protein